MRDQCTRTPTHAHPHARTHDRTPTYTGACGFANAGASLQPGASRVEQARADRFGSNQSPEPRAQSPAACVCERHGPPLKSIGQLVIRKPTKFYPRANFGLNESMAKMMWEFGSR